MIALVVFLHLILGWMSYVALSRLHATLESRVGRAHSFSLFFKRFSQDELISLTSQPAKNKVGYSLVIVLFLLFGLVNQYFGFLFFSLLWVILRISVDTIGFDQKNSLQKALSQERLVFSFLFLSLTQLCVMLVELGTVFSIVGWVALILNGVFYFERMKSFGSVAQKKTFFEFFSILMWTSASASYCFGWNDPGLLGLTISVVAVFISETVLHYIPAHSSQMISRRWRVDIGLLSISFLLIFYFARMIHDF